MSTNRGRESRSLQELIDSYNDEIMQYSQRARLQQTERPPERPLSAAGIREAGEIERESGEESIERGKTERDYWLARGKQGLQRMPAPPTSPPSHLPITPRPEPYEPLYRPGSNMPRPEPYEPLERPHHHRKNPLLPDAVSAGGHAQSPDGDGWPNEIEQGLQELAAGIREREEGLRDLLEGIMALSEGLREQEKGLRELIEGLSQSGKLPPVRPPAPGRPGVPDHPMMPGQPRPPHHHNSPRPPRPHPPATGEKGGENDSDAPQDDENSDDSDRFAPYPGRESKITSDQSPLRGGWNGSNSGIAPPDRRNAVKNAYAAPPSGENVRYSEPSAQNMGDSAPFYAFSAPLGEIMAVNPDNSAEMGGSIAPGTGAFRDTAGALSVDPSGESGGLRPEVPGTFDPLQGNANAPIAPISPENRAAQSGQSSASQSRGVGYLQVGVYTARQTSPIPGARVTVFRPAAEGGGVFASESTNDDGKAPLLRLPVGRSAPGSLEPPFAVYSVSVNADGFYPRNDLRAQIFDGVTALLWVELTPLPDGAWTPIQPREVE